MDFLEDISMSDILMVFIAMIGIMVVCAVIVGVAKSKQDAADNAQPVRRQKAKVVDKQQLAPNTIVSISDMWILFELDDGKRLRLNAKAANSLIVGDEGYLTWQGSRVRNFERT